MNKKTCAHIANNAVDHIIGTILEQIDKVQFVKQNMNSYCSNRMITLVSQMNTQVLSNPTVLQTNIHKDLQPANLYQDTFMPISNVQPLNSHPNYRNTKTASEHNKSTTNNMTQLLPTNHNMSANNKSNNYTSHKGNSQNVEPEKKDQGKLKPSERELLRLQYEYESNEKEIEQMRRQKQKQYEYERNRKTRIMEEKQKHLNQHKQVSNYDYEGKPIEVKIQPRTNLVSKMVTPKLSEDNNDSKKNKISGSTAVRQKEEEKMRKTTYLQTYLVKQEQKPNINKKIKEKNKDKQKQKQKPKEDYYRDQKPIIQFSKIKNPIEKIDVKVGVKATFNQNIIQKKQEYITDQELKKGRSNRKLSKNEYSRVKTSQIHGRIQSSHRYQVNKQQQRQKQLNSINVKQIKDKQWVHDKSRPLTSFKRRSVTDVQFEKIKVQNMNLKNFMLQKNIEPEKQRQSNKKVLDDRSSSQLKIRQQLNRIDRHNLDYSRKRLAYQPMNKIGQIQHALPKIQAKLNPQIPKPRQKTRNGSALRRQATKRFQQTLRV